jgi:hypothetical protein
MANQAREDNSFGRVPLQPAMRIGLIRYAGWTAVGHVDCIINRQIIIAARVLVQPKNILRLKGSLGPCLDDANTSQLPPLRGGLLRAVHRLYSGSEPIKWSAGQGLFLSRLQHIVEATSPVRNEKEDADHSFH